MKRSGTLPFGILIAIITLQLAVPAFQIFRHESVLENGKLFQFKVRFYDPHDPMQGRYIQLIYDIDYPRDTNIHPDSRYGVLEVGEDGFARFSELRLEKPESTPDYIGLYIEYSEPKLYCDRYYLEESIAPDAEKFFLQTLAQSETPVWVDIRVRNGHGVIETIRVDGVPLLEEMRSRMSRGAKP